MVDELHRSQSARFTLCCAAFVVGLTGFSLVYEFQETLSGGLFKSGQTVSAMKPLGVDFRCVYRWAMALRHGLPAYLAEPDNAYPPFVTVFYLPLTLLPVRYALLCFLMCTEAALFTILALSLWLLRRQGASPTSVLLLAVLVWGLLNQCYPMLFELERGNLNLLTTAIAFLAGAAIVRGRPVVATLLYAVAIQLKVYMLAIFPLFFIRVGWRKTLLLVVCDVALLFCLGPQAFLQFIGWMHSWVVAPYIWVGNHSLRSFFAWWATNRPAHPLPFSSAVVANTLLAIFAAVCVTEAWRRRAFFNFGKESIGGRFTAAELSIAGAAFTLMSLYPSVSHDIRLTIHIGPFLAFAAESKRYVAGAIIGLALGGAYGPLLFPKTPFLVAMFVAYIAAAIVELTQAPTREAAFVDSPLASD